MDTTVCKLPEDRGGRFFKLWVEWNPDQFKILLLQNGVAWSGHASHDQVKELSRLLQLSIEDYMNETKTALSTQGGASHFTYLLQDDQFMWKKLDQCSNIMMKYGYILLEKVPYKEGADKMLESLLKQFCNNKKEIVSLQKTNMVANRERIVLMEKLVEYKKQKLEMERQLFGRFLPVLNSKKEYIQQLEDRLATDNKQLGEVRSNIMKKNNHDPVPTERSPNHYDSDTEVGDTDDEGKAANDSSLGDAGDLFDDVRVPVSAIPKRISRPKRRIPEADVGPSSSSKMIRTTPDNGLDEAFNTQTLLDDL